MTIPRPDFSGMSDDEALACATDFLARLEDVVGRTPDDAEMLDGIRRLPEGTAGALGLILYGVPAIFRPDQAEGETGTVVFALDDGERTVRFCMEFLPGECRVAEPPADPDAVIRLSFAVFLRIAFKFMDGNDAYLAGLTDVTGDVFLATHLDQWFGVPGDALTDEATAARLASGARS